MNRLFKISASIIVILLGGCLSSLSYAAVDMNEFGLLLEKIKTYDFGQSREDVAKISDMIREAGAKPEIKEIEKYLDEFLKSDATYAAKQFVCEQLSITGTEASVPALAPMLADANYSDMARYALERIPGDAVNEALRNALGSASGNAKVGIINTLGVRGDKKAVALLTGLATDTNELTAGAAIAALGKIDDPCATESLAKIKDKASGTLQTQAAEAYLLCADRLAAKGQKGDALAIYRQLSALAEPIQIRTAAVRGMIITDINNKNTISHWFKSSDEQIQNAAIATLKEITEINVIKATVELIPNLASEQQIQMLFALTESKSDKIGTVALPTVLSVVNSSDINVRIAALNAIGVLGDSSTIDTLVQTASTASGSEQKTAQDALYRLRGTDVDQAILKKIPGAIPKAKIELIRSCDQRNITSAAPLLIKAAKDANETVRIESIKALRNLANENDLAGLIELQMAASGADRIELEKAVVAVARKIPADRNPAGKVIAALAAAGDVEARCSLLSVLSKIGDPAALPTLRESLEDKQDKIKDAAVRSLSDWPTAEAAADLLKVAKTSDNTVRKQLALRGYIRLTGLVGNRPDEKTIEMYKEAMALAPSPVEKQMVLSGLANMKALEALKMAAGLLDDAELKQEAEAAVVKIAESTIQNHPEQTRELLQKILAGTTSDSVRQQTQFLLQKGK